LREKPGLQRQAAGMSLRTIALHGSQADIRILR
jgi:hypothetical protein